MLINSQEKLDLLCAKLEQEKTIALDTEFVRRTTYYAKLSLIQIAESNGNISIIDVNNLDLTPFKNLLLNEKVLKILHAALQDFENFYNLFKAMPVNVFDTQIAARFCGFRRATSYAELCREIAHNEIDKTYQAADWLARPISNEVLAYAAKDVEHLHEIYHYLSEKISDKEQYNDALNKELLDPDLYKLRPERAWKKVKSNQQHRYDYDAMRALAAFREECAASLDIPRGFFITDDDLVRICRFLPTSVAELSIHKQKTNWITTDKYRNKLLDLCAALKDSLVD